MDQPGPQKVVPPLERFWLGHQYHRIIFELYHRVINMSNINWKRTAFASRLVDGGTEVCSWQECREHLGRPFRHPYL